MMLTEKNAALSAEKSKVVSSLPANNDVIKIDDKDVIFKLNKDICSLKNVQIPQNATVLDATDCKALYDLSGITRYKNLHTFLLSGTEVNSMELAKLPPETKAVDLRYCKQIRSLSGFRFRPNLRVLINFSSERMLNSIPDNIVVQVLGSPVSTKLITTHNNCSMEKAQHTYA